MKTLVHISDLHFGRVDERLLGPLTARVGALEPDLVAVSGDLTQRARASEFRAARVFLDGLGVNRIVVPGNHDVPLYNPFTRLLTPLRKYKKYITPELLPFHVDDEIAVLGLNTAWPWSVQDGRLTSSQFRRMRSFLGGLAQGVVKIVVTHHPLSVGSNGNKQMIGSREALEVFASCGADVFLAGHRHVSGVEDSTSVVRVHGYNALMIEAGTATSTRARGEANAFNVLRVSRGTIEVASYRWDIAKGAFEAERPQHYVRGEHGWGRA